MTPISNQPILFSQGAEPDCCPDILWRQKMFDTDVIRWQFMLEPCFDATELISNPNFTSTSNWTLGGSASISGDTARLPSSGDYISQTTAMPEGVWLEITINIEQTELNASNSRIKIIGFDQSILFTPAPGTFKFYAQSLSEVVKIDHSFNTSQFQTVDLRIGSFSVKEIAFPSAEIQDLSGGTIDNSVPVYVSAQYATWEYTPIQDVIDNGQFRIEVSRNCSGNIETWTSEPICTIPENDCDIQIGVCAQTNVYGDNFEPLIRLTAEMKKGTSYQTDRLVVESNTGKQNLAYGRRNKSYQLNIPMLPEHVRDFIYFLPMCNEIAIRQGLGDTHSYFVSDDPDEPQPVAGTRDLTNNSIALVRKHVLEETIFIQDCGLFLPPYVIGTHDIDEAIQTDTDELIQA